MARHRASRTAPFLAQVLRGE
nr:hypothetical protein XACLD7_3680001 [Xanthomonas citri pv. citri]